MLHDLRMVIQFPPNALILIPSAILHHSNVPIQDGDRASFTFYVSQKLIHNVDNGFMTDKFMEANHGRKFEHMKKLKETRWKWALSLFSTLGELEESVESELVECS